MHGHRCHPLASLGMIVGLVVGCGGGGGDASPAGGGLRDPAAPITAGDAEALPASPLTASGSDDDADPGLPAADGANDGANDSPSGPDGGGAVDGSGSAPDGSSGGGSSGATEPLATGVWAVVLAGASQPNDPLLAEVVAEVADLGHDVTPTNCDRGAADVLGMSPESTFTVSIHFDTEVAASAALDDLTAADIPGHLAEIDIVCPD